MIYLALGVLYLVVGYLIAWQSQKAWFGCDNESWIAFLAFPWTFRRGRVGHFHNWMFAKEKESPRAYIIAVTIGWPLKVLWNVPGIVYGLIRGRRP